MTQGKHWRRGEREVSCSKQLGGLFRKSKAMRERGEAAEATDIVSDLVPEGFQECLQRCIGYSKINCIPGVRKVSKTTDMHEI